MKMTTAIVCNKEKTQGLVNCRFILSGPIFSGDLPFLSHQLNHHLGDEELNGGAVIFDFIKVDETRFKVNKIFEIIYHHVSEKDLIGRNIRMEIRFNERHRELFQVGDDIMYEVSFGGGRQNEFLTYGEIDQVIGATDEGVLSARMLCKRMEEDGNSGYSSKVCTHGIKIRLMVDAQSELQEISDALLNMDIRRILPWIGNAELDTDRNIDIGLLAIYESGAIRSIGNIESVNKQGVTISITDGIDLIDPDSDTDEENSYETIIFGVVI